MPESASVIAPRCAAAQLGPETGTGSELPLAIDLYCGLGGWTGGVEVNLTSVLLSVFVVCGVIVITAAVIIGSGILIEIGKVEERKAEERE